MCNVRAYAIHSSAIQPKPVRIDYYFRHRNGGVRSFVFGVGRITFEWLTDTISEHIIAISDASTGDAAAGVHGRVKMDVLSEWNYWLQIAV